LFNKLTLVAITALLVFFSFNPVDSILALTPKERYASGFGHGCSDAKAAGHPYLNTHPTHTIYFMNLLVQFYC
jgi:hypothetical protein